MQMIDKVYAICRGYTDQCTYTADDFDSVELFYNEQDALYRQMELEELIPEDEKEFNFVNFRVIIIR